MEKDYPDIEEVDVKLLRLCRENGGTVVTNDYNLNKVAGVTGIRVLNINDLANAVKPMLMAGEELTGADRPGGQGTRSGRGLSGRRHHDRSGERPPPRGRARSRWW